MLSNILASVAVLFLVYGGVAVILGAAKVVSGRAVNATPDMVALVIGFILLIWRA